MPLKPQELGERMHVDLRAGVTGIDKWRGVCREGDPASIRDEQLWYTENSRLTGGKIISRGGQTAVNTVAADGCIDGFFDAGDMGAQNPGAYVGPPARGFYMGAMVGTFDGSVAETLSAFDPLTDSFTVVTNSSAGHIRGWARLGESVYVVVGPNEIVDVSYTTTPGMTIRQATALSLTAATFADIATFGPGQEETAGPRGMAEFDGDLYVTFYDTSVFPTLFTIVKSDGVSTATTDYSWEEERNGPAAIRAFTAEDLLVVVTDVPDGVDLDMVFLTRNTSGTWTEYSTASLVGSGGETHLKNAEAQSTESDGTSFPIEFDSKMFQPGQFIAPDSLFVMVSFSNGAFTLDEEFDGYTFTENLPAVVFNSHLYFVLKRLSDNHFLLAKRSTAGTYTLAEYDFGTTGTNAPQALFATATNLYYVTSSTTGTVVEVFKSTGTNTTAFAEVDSLSSSADLAETGITVS